MLLSSNSLISTCLKLAFLILTLQNSDLGTLHSSCMSPLLPDVLDAAVFMASTKCSAHALDMSAQDAEQASTSAATCTLQQFRTASCQAAASQRSLLP